MARWTNPDVVALSVPISGALALFGYTIFRAFTKDPEWSRSPAFYERSDAVEIGERYRTEYSQWFQSGRMSLFPNRVDTN